MGYERSGTEMLRKDKGVRIADVSPNRREAVAVGAAVAILWGFHAAAAALPGRAYFFVTKLNDALAPVRPTLFLHPAFLCALLFAGFRQTSMWRRAPRGTKFGLTAALACWFVAGTLSSIANFGTDEVVVTYGVTFLAGAALYAALQGTLLDASSFEIGLVGLAVGSLFPLIGGIVAFVQEWGSLDLDTTLGAYKDLLRMQLYEAATFGSRSNTATFVVIIFPIFLWVLLDKSRGRLVRALSGLMLIPILANVLILEVRAAFLTLFFATAAAFGFKLGVRRYPLFAAGVVLSLVCVSNYLPDVMNTMSERLRPVVTVDTVEDASVSDRVDAINEGWAIGMKHWVLGIGPGAGLTLHSLTSAHQFNVQQFMESGVVGLIASAMFAGSVLLLLLQTAIRGQDSGTNNIRFALLIGPASVVVYGIFSNPTLSLGYVNTWAVLVISMLALAPGFTPRSVRAGAVERQPASEAATAVLVA